MWRSNPTPRTSKMQPPEEGSTADFRFCYTVDRVQATNGLPIYTYTKWVVFENILIFWALRSFSSSFGAQLVSSTVFARRFSFYVVICVLSVCAAIIPNLDW